MEFLRPSRRRTLISEIAYILLNVGVAAIIFAVVLTVGNPLPAYALVLLSKWRVLAVRPQYWLTNIISNAVDIIIGLSFVTLLYAASGIVAVQLVLTVLYVVWLLFIKPQSKRSMVILQAGIGAFLGVEALAGVSYNWWASAVVLCMWIIGVVTARHVLTAYKEPHFMLLSLIWGLIAAELGWLFYHWQFAYRLPNTGSLMLAQSAIIITLLGFLAERAYASYYHHKTIRLNDMILPLLLVLSCSIVLLTVFNVIQRNLSFLS